MKSKLQTCKLVTLSLENFDRCFYGNYIFLTNNNSSTDFEETMFGNSLYFIISHERGHHNSYMLPLFLEQLLINTQTMNLLAFD